MRLIARFVKAVAVWILALILVFEEWGWEPLQRLLARIAHWPVFAQIERRVAALGPRAALGVFALPALMLLPIKLLAVWAIARGHALFGLLVILAAKLGGTAIVARLFTLTRPALLRMPWFARLYERWTNWKDELLARVRASWPWRAGRIARRMLIRAWRRAAGNGESARV